MSDYAKKRCSCPNQPKCPHVGWYLRDFQHHGAVYRDNITRWAAVVLGTPIGNTKTEAEAVALTMRERIQKGSFVKAKKFRPAAAVALKGGTLDDVAAIFDTDYITANPKKRPNSKTNDRAILKRLRAVRVDRGRLGTLAMDTITFDHLKLFAQESSALSNSTWNKDRTLIGQLFRWAQWKGHIAVDPLASTPRDLLKQISRRKAAQRNRLISDVELANLRQAATELRVEEDSQRITAMLETGFECGCRVGELLALQVRDLRLPGLERLSVRGEEVGGAKTYETARELPVPARIRDIIRRRLVDPAGRPLPRTAYVFGSPYGDRIKSIDKAWNTTVLRANNIEPKWTANGDFDEKTRATLQNDIDLHFNDIRHEAASRWHATGKYTLRAIQRLLGHTTIAQTATYLNISDDSVFEASEAWDAQQGAAKHASTPHKAHTNAKAAAAFQSMPRLRKRDNSRKVSSL
jgi:integrase